jgi:diguanylate cyclase (GGDEF)-like protein
MCDLDHFKIVNDSYGHHGCDAVLRAFSELLKQMTRKHIDSVVRYGGEEFLLVLPETDLYGGVLLAERLRVAFSAAATIHEVGQNISATASFGVATVDFARSRKMITLDSLIATADKLLYDAKTGGRNQVKSLQLS